MGLDWLHFSWSFLKPGLFIQAQNKRWKWFVNLRFDFDIVKFSLMDKIQKYILVEKIYCECWNINTAGGLQRDEWSEHGVVQ